MPEAISPRCHDGKFRALPLEPGEKYNMLTVIERTEKRGNNWAWSCLCDCGAVTEALASNIRSGNTKSCGCHKRLISATKCKTHGSSGTRSYWLWNNMMRRCNDQRNPHYSNYGGRGITVYARWHEFQNFHADMGERPPAHSLERKNNDLGYCLGNCRWATRSDQARNTRSNVIITRGGETKTMAEWAEITGIPYARIQGRRRMGWNDEELFLGKRTKRINGGTNGLADRQALYARALEVLA